ncbi:MAG: peptidoglycan-binding protein, partial [Oscillospiraceae bacterium]|nr:peptidoglycan-binding protein [Oscillospiraceae bacterium]
MARNNRNKEMRRREIYDLQNMLYVISRFENENPDVLPDGIHGEKTTQAITKFQLNNGIEPSGNADFETWDAISRKYNEVLINRSRPAHIHFFEIDEIPSLKKGDSSDAVVLVQMLFRRLSRDFLGYSVTEISGIFDDITEKNVKEFQRINLLNQSGEVNRETWDRITMYY